MKKKKNKLTKQQKQLLGVAGAVSVGGLLVMMFLRKKTTTPTKATSSPAGISPAPAKGTAVVTVPSVKQVSPAAKTAQEDSLPAGPTSAMDQSLWDKYYGFAFDWMSEEPGEFKGEIPQKDPVSVRQDFSVTQAEQVRLQDQKVPAGVLERFAQYVSVYHPTVFKYTQADIQEFVKGWTGTTYGVLYESFGAAIKASDFNDFIKKISAGADIQAAYAAQSEAMRSGLLSAESIQAEAQKSLATNVMEYASSWLPW